MAFAGFTCSKNALIGLNILYILVGFILIGVAAYGQTSNIISSISLIGGIVACGVFLLLVSLLGLVGAFKHHQVILFFYMVILFLLFLIQFSIACACLAMDENQQRSLTQTGWKLADPSLKREAQSFFQCCGYDNATQSLNVSNNTPMGHPECPTSCCDPADLGKCCYGNNTCACQTCESFLVNTVSSGLQVSGGIGLFFSFTEIVGIVITYLYRGMAHDVIS